MTFLETQTVSLVRLSVSHAGDFWLQQGFEPLALLFLGVTVALTVKMFHDLF